MDESKPPYYFKKVSDLDYAIRCRESKSEYPDGYRVLYYEGSPETARKTVRLLNKAWKNNNGYQDR